MSCFPGSPAVKILMPALSPTMEEGNIVKWLKKEGERQLSKMTNLVSCALVLQLIMWTIL